MNLPRFFAPSPETSLATLLFHHFFYPGEALESGRDRLRRQLDWLSNAYSPVAPKNLSAHLAAGTFPKCAALVTIDDANIEYPKVEDIFRSFGIPVLMFVCVGWSDIAEPHEQGAALARIVALLQWGEAADDEIAVGYGLPPIRLAEQYLGERAAVIDRLIAARDQIEPGLATLADRLYRILYSVKSQTTCSWSELRDLATAGTIMGCHSVSHVHLSQASDTRLAFEITEARKIIGAKFGECQYFAYPFGTPNSFNEKTAAEVMRAGFDCAFLTHAEFADRRTDRYHLPRLVIPDYDVSVAEFRAIVRGGGIPLEKAKRLLRNVYHAAS